VHRLSYPLARVAGVGKGLIWTRRSSLPLRLALTCLNEGLLVLVVDKRTQDLSQTRQFSTKEPGAKTPSGVGIGEQAVDNIEVSLSITAVYDK
jgi:hypothetical protein